MRKFLKSLVLSYFFLLAGNSAEICSSEQKKIDLNPNILISNSIEEKEIITVTSNGFGTTLEFAAQNAAGNALTQVVGSFIDSETQIKKQKEIRDGVISETTIIKKDIRDYSQGSIKYFEILNIQQNGSIFNVTARVDVRVDDFRKYIKELALQTKEISTTNLFAEMGSKTENLDNKYELLKKVITPIYEGEVIDINIGNLQTLNSFFTSKDCLDNFDKRLCNPDQSIIHSKFNIEKTVVFPFSIEIKENFFQNSLNIFENVSDKKTTSVSPIYGKDMFESIGRGSQYYFYNSKDIGVIFRDHKNQTTSYYYLLKEIRDRMKDPKNQKYLYNDRNLSKLRISLLGNSGQTIYAFEEDCRYYSDYLRDYKGQLTNKIIEISAMSTNYIGKINSCSSQLYKYYSGKFDFTSKRSFRFFFEVEDLEKLKDFREIKIEYI